MPAENPRRGCVPLSITQYVIGFFIVLLVFLSLIGYGMFSEIHILSQKTNLNNQKAARQELTETIAQITTTLEHTARAASAWDELRQQFNDPSYYNYWHGSRALNTGVLPGSLDAIELYESNGKSFSGPSTNNAPMPASINKNEMGLSLVKASGHNYLYYFFPVWADEEHQILLGFAGLKLDFLSKINSLRKFRYLDLKTLHVDSQEGQRLANQEIISNLKFSLAPNQATDELEKIMHNTLYRVGAMIVFATFFAYFILTFLLARPLRQLSSHINTIRDEQTNRLLVPARGKFSVSELENVRLSLNDYQQRLEAMHLKLEHKNNELWTLANHDPLTGIFNRRAFEDDCANLVKIAVGNSVHTTFLLFDCDHFKAINDTYGHQVGDMVIQGIAEAIHAALRTDDRLYRLGGDEFATLLYDTDIPHATKIAERCTELINAYDFYSLGIKEPVRVSIGLAHTSGLNREGLIVLHKQADLAMYNAKRPGQPNIAVYTDEMATHNESLVSNVETHAIYQAVSSIDMFQMHYQEVVHLPGNNTDYYEALVRIKQGNNLIMPSGIFPVVEARRLEVEFDLAVIERIRHDLENGIVPSGTGVSINVSGPSIVNEEIKKKLLLFKPFLPNYKLVLEITETSLITQISHASTNLNQLRKAGFVIALDDFGSGYSSIRYLSSMPVDVIKFDISMIHSLQNHDKQCLIVENLARLLKNADYQLVAEGIETAELLEKVTQLEFTHAQGFFLGKPQPFAQ